MAPGQSIAEIHEGPCNIDHMVAVDPTDDSRVSKDSLVGLTGTGQGSRVRGHGVCRGFRLSHLGDDNRFSRPRSLRREWKQTSRRPHALNEHQDHLGTIIFDQIVSNIQNIQCRLVTRRHDKTEMQCFWTSPVKKGKPDTATL